MKLPQVQRILMAFEKQVQIMDIKEEMLNESVDNAIGEEEQDTERYCQSQNQRMCRVWL